MTFIVKKFWGDKSDDSNKDSIIKNSSRYGKYENKSCHWRIIC